MALASAVVSTLLPVQVPAQLPDAPVPAVTAQHAIAAAPPLDFSAAPHPDATSDAPAEPATQDKPQADPPLTMFPHSESGRYWISGQANSIFQMHGHFHSP